MGRKGVPPAPLLCIPAPALKLLWPHHALHWGKKWLWPQPNLLFNGAFTLQPDCFPAPPRLPVLAREVGGGGRAQRCSFPLQRSSELCFPAVAADEEPFCLVFQAVSKSRSICRHWWALTKASLWLKTGWCVARQLGLLLPSVLFFSACFFILVEQSSLAFLKAKHQVAEKTVAVETERIKVITARIKHTGLQRLHSYSGFIRKVINHHSGAQVAGDGSLQTK